MTTIAEENRKALRQALNVLCGFRETSDEPTSVTAINCNADYEGLANLNPGMLPATIMDLSGDGFPNDGTAVPMQTDTDSFRYGYISNEATNSDGYFDNPPGLTISATESWERVTVELRGQYGESRTVMYEPVWTSGQTSVYIDSWNPGERVYIVGVFLGKAWIWNNSNLLSVSLDLRSVNTEIGGELEVSSIEIQAYEKTDFTDIIGAIPTGAPIWYASGYAGDISEIRRFYLSETVSWDDNILTVKGQDASMLLENQTIPVYCGEYKQNVKTAIISRIEEALQTISYNVAGVAPTISINSLSTLYEEAAARTIISELTGFFRDDNNLRMTYVDAGRPTLYFGGNGTNWTVYADEIADLNIIVEAEITTLRLVIPEYYIKYNNNIDEIGATSGRQYFVELDPPVPNGQLDISPTPTSYTQITSGEAKFKAAATTTYKIAGYEMLSDLTDSNNPYEVSNGKPGKGYTLDFELPDFITGGGVSLTKTALAALLDRSNILYEFTYRGNPHIQPRDLVYVEIATWENGSMTKHWETMTVDTVTLEHSEGGGLSSKVKARKGLV